MHGALSVIQGLANTKSELAILHKEQTRLRVNGWLDQASGLSTVRGVSGMDSIVPTIPTPSSKGGSHHRPSFSGTLAAGSAAVAHPPPSFPPPPPEDESSSKAALAPTDSTALGTAFEMSLTADGHHLADGHVDADDASFAMGAIPSGVPELQRLVLELRAELDQALIVQQQAVRQRSLLSLALLGLYLHTCPLTPTMPPLLQVKDKVVAEASAKEAEAAKEKAETAMFTAAASAAAAFPTSGGGGGLRGVKFPGGGMMKKEPRASPMSPMLHEVEAAREIAMGKLKEDLEKLKEERDTVVHLRQVRGSLGLLLDWVWTGCPD